MLKRILSAVAIAALPLSASAAPVVFEATPTDPGGAFDIVIAAGSFPAPDPQSQFVGNVFGGVGFAISGRESFSGQLSGGGQMTALSFDIFEPTTPQKLEGCNTGCVNSTFTLTLSLGGTALAASYLISPVDDTITTFSLGTSAGLVFDTFTVTETTGGIDNEFFANFSATLAPIPLPAPGLMLLGGLGLLAFRKRLAA